MEELFPVVNRRESGLVGENDETVFYVHAIIPKKSIGLYAERIVPSSCSKSYPSHHGGRHYK